MGESLVRPADAAFGHRPRRLSRRAPQSPRRLVFLFSLITRSSAASASAPQYRAAGRAECIVACVETRDKVNLRAAPPMDLSAGVMLVGADLGPLRRQLHSHWPSPPLICKHAGTWKFASFPMFLSTWHPADNTNIPSMDYVPANFIIYFSAFIFKKSVTLQWKLFL